MSVEAGLAALAEGRFYEAHELLETSWRTASGSERILLQAVIQIAGACLHLQRGRSGAAVTLLGRAGTHLAGAAPGRFGIDVSRLCREVEELRAALERGEGGDCTHVVKAGR